MQVLSKTINSLNVAILTRFTNFYVQVRIEAKELFRQFYVVFFTKGPFLSLKAMN